MTKWTSSNTSAGIASAPDAVWFFAFLELLVAPASCLTLFIGSGPLTYVCFPSLNRKWKRIQMNLAYRDRIEPQSVCVCVLHCHIHVFKIDTPTIAAATFFVWSRPHSACTISVLLISELGPTPFGWQDLAQVSKNPTWWWAYYSKLKND